MGILVLVCAFLLFARAESYVLLTANVDDIHAIANQLVKSPVVGHLKDIWHRASKTFTTEYAKFRAGDSDMDQSQETSKEGDDTDDSVKTQRRRAINRLVELGRNATTYLMQMFQNL